MAEEVEAVEAHTHKGTNSFQDYAENPSQLPLHKSYSCQGLKRRITARSLSNLFAVRQHDKK